MKRRVRRFQNRQFVRWRSEGRRSRFIVEIGDRKRKLFKPEHIRKAWQRLHDQGWLGQG